MTYLQSLSKIEGLTKQKERGKKPLTAEEVLLLESDALHADYLLGNELNRLEKKLCTAEACEVSEADETATSVQTATVNKVTTTMDPMIAGN